MPKRREPRIPIESLVGGKIAPERDALRGMRTLESRLAAEFKAHADTRSRLEKARGPLQQALIEQIGDGSRATAKALAALHAQRAKRQIQAPPRRQEQARIYTGSIGATVVPPFDYQWTWTAQNGGARNFPVANRQTGVLDVACDTAEHNGSSAWTRAALGIYFHPVVTNGILRVSANPGFTFDWSTLCTLASAHSDAFIGLYVGSYTMSGGFESAPVDQMVWLWRDDSWWEGAGINRGSNSGFPLFAQFNVDSAHWYAIWVWGGTSVNAAGWSTFSGSGAGASLSGMVPSISWELF